MTNQEFGSKRNSKKLAAGYIFLSTLSYEERPASHLLALRQSNSTESIGHDPISRHLSQAAAD